MTTVEKVIIWRGTLGRVDRGDGDTRRVGGEGDRGGGDGERGDGGREERGRG